MAYFQKNEKLDNSSCVHFYEGIDAESLKAKLHDLLIKEGYNFVDGNAGSGVYEKGNRVMRILFGAFIKYFKFAARAESAQGGARIVLEQKTSGMSGGLIGVSQVKKEMKRMADVLKSI